MRRRFFKQFARAGDGQLHIPENDESGNIQLVVNAAQGQLARQTRDMQCVIHEIDYSFSA